MNLLDLSCEELNNLHEEINKLLIEKSKQNQEKAKYELLCSEELKQFKVKLKELTEEYEELCTKITSLTLMIPIKFILGLETKEITKVLLKNRIFPTIYFDDLFRLELKSELLTELSNLNKIQKIYIEKELQSISENICDEVLNLFPEVKEKLENFVDKVNKETVNMIERLEEAKIPLKDLLNKA